LFLAERVSVELSYENIAIFDLTPLPTPTDETHIMSTISPALRAYADESLDQLRTVLMQTYGREIEAVLLALAPN
jgi:hypothetical protein